MDDLLQIDLRLLLLRYGRRRILDALAALGDQTPEEVEAQITLAEKRKASRKTKTPSSAVELVAQVCPEKPESTQILKTLATRYDNRTFLPQLRDVQRFLDRIGSSHGRLKSRRAAARQVLTGLCRLSVDELERLLAS